MADREDKLIGALSEAWYRLQNAHLRVAGRPHDDVQNEEALNELEEAVRAYWQVLQSLSATKTRNDQLRQDPAL